MDKKNSRRRIARCLQVMVVCAAATAEVHAEVDFRLLASSEASWVDNIDLVADDDPAYAKQSEYVLRVAPGFVFEQTGQRVNSSIGYELQSYFYAEDDNRNSAYHQAHANADVALVKEYFFFDVSGAYTQQVIDATVATTNNLLFDTVNTADALTGQAGLAFRHEYDNVLADMRYSRGIVRYTVSSDDAATLTEPLQDVETSYGYATLASADDLARLTWALHYENQEAIYDVSPRYRSESANAELGLLIGSGFRLIGRGGLESDPLADSTHGGFDDSFWEAGFRWVPSSRTSLEALYGEHTFGETYSGRIAHEARLLVMEARYSEGPTTLAQELALQPVANVVGEAGSLVPGSDFFNSINSDVYLREDGEASITLKGQRTQIELSGYQFKRTYIQGTRTGGVEKTRGAGIGITRSFSSTLQMDLGVRYTESLFDAVNIPVSTGGLPIESYEFDDTLATLGFKQQLSPRVDLRLAANHLRRGGDLEYTVNVVTLGISGEF